MHCGLSGWSYFQECHSTVHGRPQGGQEGALDSLASQNSMFFLSFLDENSMFLGVF
jgi:hypothetical protein